MARGGFLPSRGVRNPGRLKTRAMPPSFPRTACEVLGSRFQSPYFGTCLAVRRRVAGASAHGISITLCARSSVSALPAAFRCRSVSYWAATHATRFDSRSAKNSSSFIITPLVGAPAGEPDRMGRKARDMVLEREDRSRALCLQPDCLCLWFQQSDGPGAACFKLPVTSFKRQTAELRVRGVPVLRASIHENNAVVGLGMSRIRHGFLRSG